MGAHSASDGVVGEVGGGRVAANRRRRLSVQRTKATTMTALRGAPASFVSAKMKGRSWRSSWTAREDEGEAIAAVVLVGSVGAVR